MASGRALHRVLGLRPRPPRASDVRRTVAGRVVVITGASRGIGAECARRFARAGAHVVLLARSADDLETVAQDIRSAGGLADTVAVDLRDLDAAAAAARGILDSFGAPVVVVANAGHSIHRTLAEYADRGHDVTRMTGVNFLGPVALLRVLAPAMRSGRIVTVSTVGALVPAPGWSVYASTKAAFDMWLSAIGTELAPHVTTSLVRLPLVRTAMSAPTSAYRAAPAMRPVDAVASIARAVVTGRRVVQPWWAHAAAVLLAVAPRALEPALRAQERRLRAHAAREGAAAATPDRA